MTAPDLSLSTCLECGTPFAGLACPTCGQRLEVRDLAPYTTPGECLDRLSAEAAPDLGGAVFDRPEVA